MEPQLVVVVHVKLLGFLTQLSKHKELDMEIEAGSTVADLIHLLAEELGQEFQQAILDRHGNLHGGVEVTLNRQHISARKISEITLSTGSDLAIIPMVGGGQE